MGMAVTTFKLSGKEYVVLPKKEFVAMRASAKSSLSRANRAARPSKQDLADLRRIEAIKRDPREKPIPWEQVRKRLA